MIFSDLNKITIDSLPNTSSLTIRRLKLLKIKTFWDLLNYFPFRYENYSLISAISDLQEGEKVTVKGVVLDIKSQYTKKGLTMQKATIYDRSGKIDVVWYNQPYLLRLIKNGSIISVAGEVKKFITSLIIQSEEYELISSLEDKKTIHTGRIIPIYPERKGLSSKTIREKIYMILNKNYFINEILPEEIINFNNLIGENDAYKNIHFPINQEMAQKAKSRLSFDEIFTIRLSSQLIKREWDKEKVSCPLTLDFKKKQIFDNFLKQLPFKLTQSQKKSLLEIISDLKKERPMNRLLQGDVGSGKTVVAAAASYFSYLNGFKTLFMAPTELLAYQHHKTFNQFFTESLKKDKLNIVLLTATNKVKQGEIKRANIIIGTHALIQNKIVFDEVALVIIDEQHKFGVAQRAELKKKALESHKKRFNPHLLTMTATPIPRTVALTLYGELDLSIIDEMPPGRIPVKTFIVPQEKRKHAYQWIKKQIKQFGSQVFIVCPLIEQSQVETLLSVKAAKKEYEYLKNSVFSEFVLGLVHGKMKSKEKEKIMKEFAENKINILVATPVVEVGVDIPNANIIIIEAAERFGLAQLHQLRGRVGRNNKQAYCLLFTSEKDQYPERLKIFSKINNGFTLAEHDLKIRGTGDIYGTKQHGVINLKIASLSDFKLINQTNNAVNYFLYKYQINHFLPLKKRIENYRINIISQD